MDGIGFGDNDPESNPFAKASIPNLETLLGDHNLVNGVAPLESERASLLELDVTLGMPGCRNPLPGHEDRFHIEWSYNVRDFA